MSHVAVDSSCPGRKAVRALRLSLSQSTVSRLFARQFWALLLSSQCPNVYYLLQTRWLEEIGEGKIELSNLGGWLLFQGFSINESFNEIHVGMENTLSRAQDPWHLLGWLTWRGDLVRHTVRWLLPNVPAPSMTSRRIRVLGTKLQERPRAGLNLLPSLSRVKWLVTCRYGQLPFTDRESDLRLSLVLELIAESRPTT